MSKKSFFICICLFLTIGVAAFFYWQQSVTTAHLPVKSPSDSKFNPGKIGTEQSSEVTKSDSNPVLPADPNSSKTGEVNKSANPKDKALRDPENYGKTPSVLTNTNSNTASVAEAIKTHSHPERLSVMIQPAPFDPNAYRQNPQAYLSVIEPGRVSQPKQPAADVPRIRTVSPTFQRMAQGQSIELQVRAVPKFPVTWTNGT